MATDKNNPEGPIDPSDLEYRKHVAARNWEIGRILSLDFTRYTEFKLRKRSAYYLAAIYETYEPLGCNSQNAFESSKMRLLAPLASKENLAVLKEIAESCTQRDLLDGICRTEPYKILAKDQVEKLKRARSKRPIL